MEMVEALDKAGLRGRDVEANSDRSYFVTTAQLEALGIRD
jgi:hypothetical protein